MIPFDFEYYKPTEIQEALQTFQNIKRQGKKVIFYSGGTEFITFSRMNQLTADAVIDIKGIPECNVLQIQNNQLIIGACNSLNKITESNLFPLLGQTVKQVADHTSRNKITIGGNMNSRLIYREAVLPLLVSDAKVKIAGSSGEAILPLEDVFHQKLNIEADKFLVQIIVEKEFIDYVFFQLKRTRFSKVGYPTVTVAALVKDKKIRAAFSGVCEFPFRSAELEALFNDSTLSIEERIIQAGCKLPAPIIDDIQASREYREFVLKIALEDTFAALKEAMS